MLDNKYIKLFDAKTIGVIDDFLKELKKTSSKTITETAIDINNTINEIAKEGTTWYNNTMGTMGNMDNIDALSELDINKTIKFRQFNIVNIKDGVKVFVAVPGFTSEDITIEFIGSILKINGKSPKLFSEYDSNKFLHNHIDINNFEKKIRINKPVEAIEYFVKNGILTVELLYKIYKSSEPTIKCI